jgi:hypothetical protein
LGTHLTKSPLGDITSGGDFTTMKKLGYLWFITAIITMTFLGCNLPNSAGLTSTISGTESSGTTVITVGDLNRELRLVGNYSVDAGSLSVTVTNPDSILSFDTEYSAGNSGKLDKKLTPVLGDWILSVSTTDFSGSYEFRFVY